MKTNFRRPGPHTPLVLYHYTNTKGFLGIVESRKLWASSVHCLNDALEYRYAFDFLRGYCNDANPFPAEITRAVLRALGGDEWRGVELQSRFVASFSEVRDDLSQWRAYGRPAPGFSIGFDSGALESVSKKLGFQLVPCVYDGVRQTEQVTELIRSVLEGPGIDPSPPGMFELTANEIIAGMIDIASHFKHPKFEGEVEWRLISKSIPSNSSDIKYREGVSLVVPYLEIKLASEPKGIPVREVFVGPSPIQGIACVTAFDALAAYGCDLTPADVKPSGVPFRDW